MVVNYKLESRKVGTLVEKSPLSDWPWLLTDMEEARPLWMTLPQAGRPGPHEKKVAEGLL